MSFKLFGIRIKIDFLFTAIIALLAIIDTQGIMWQSLVAVVVHELGHIAAMLILKVEIRCLRLSCCGILIDGDCCSSFANSIIVALSGPIINIIFFTVMHKSSFGIIMLVTAVFNLLPIIGTDGGDVLRIVIFRIFGYDKAKIAFSIISSFITLIIFACGVMLLTLYGNPTLLASSLYFIIMTVASIISE